MEKNKKRENRRTKKKDIPESLPDLVVKAVKYKLSGPGLNARRKLDKMKDNNI